MKVVTDVSHSKKHWENGNYPICIVCFLLVF